MVQEQQRFVFDIAYFYHIPNRVKSICYRLRLYCRGHLETKLKLKIVASVVDLKKFVRYGYLRLDGSVTNRRTKNTYLISCYYGPWFSVERKAYHEKETIFSYFPTSKSRDDFISPKWNEYRSLLLKHFFQPTSQVRSGPAKQSWISIVVKLSWASIEFTGISSLTAQPKLTLQTIPFRSSHS